MKKIFLIVPILFLIYACTSCVNRVEIPIGKDATKDFSVNSHIANDAVYQASNFLEISGKAESGVVIVMTLLDYRGFVVEKIYDITDNNGSWKILLNTPKLSDKNYTIKIADSKEKFKKEYTNIRFGEVWLVLGDKIKESLFMDTSEQEKTASENQMFYIDGKWQFASETISVFGMKLINQMIEKNHTLLKSPIAIVFATSDELSNAYSWLSKDIIDSRLSIKKYLESNGLYKEDINNITENDMAYYYETKLKNIEKFSFSKIIWNQGLKDFTDMKLQNVKFEYDYSQILFNLFSELEGLFSTTTDILVLQESSNFVQGSEQLRKVQNNVCSYFAKCKIITTYDLNVVVKKGTNEIIEKENIKYTQDEIEIQGLNLDLLCDRIVTLSMDKNDVASVNNILQVYNDEKMVTSIKLIFNNNVRFDLKDTEKINGLEFFDENDELIELDYEFVDNQIIIFLSEEVIQDEIVDDEKMGEVMIHKISRISYAQSNFIYDNNITVNGIAIHPFEFILENK